MLDLSTIPAASNKESDNAKIYPPIPPVQPLQAFSKTKGEEKAEKSSPLIFLINPAINLVVSEVKSVYWYSDGTFSNPPGIMGLSKKKLLLFLVSK